MEFSNSLTFSERGTDKTVCEPLGPSLTTFLLKLRNKFFGLQFKLPCDRLIIYSLVIAGMSIGYALER